MRIPPARPPLRRVPTLLVLTLTLTVTLASCIHHGRSTAPCTGFYRLSETQISPGMMLYDGSGEYAGTVRALQPHVFYRGGNSEMAFAVAPANSPSGYWVWHHMTGAKSFWTPCAE